MNRRQARKRFKGTEITPAAQAADSPAGDLFQVVPVTGERGRPRKGADLRQTLPLTRRGERIPGPWQGDENLQRRQPYTLSIKNLDWGRRDVAYLLELARDISSDVARAQELAVRLSHTPWRVSAKKPASKPGTPPSEEDPVATQLLRKLAKTAFSQVAADVPGAIGGIDAAIDQWLADGYGKGAMCEETVLESSRRAVTDIVHVDPFTIAFRRDTGRPGKYLIGQVQATADPKLIGGWKPLNPNLVTYYPLGDTLHGVVRIMPALQVLPYWMRYLGNLNIFFHNAAFGFLDGEVTTEALMEMWRRLTEDEKARHNHSFLAWAIAVAEQVSEDYKEQGERDPDAIIAHLDLLKIKAEGTGKATFPVDEGRRAYKKEMHPGLHTPSPLLGEDAPQGGEHFASLDVSAYHSFLRSLQAGVKHLLERAFTVALQVAGYSREVEVQVEFDPIPVDDRLTEAQAVQLEILNELKLRDENMRSQNEASVRLTGTPALGPAPLSNGADPDGPSGPDMETMMNRAADSPMMQNGAASGPSFGGRKQQKKDTDPQQDKRQGSSRKE